MSKIWSISTTVRNPYRIPIFLAAAKNLENQIWNENSQIYYQILLIVSKEYVPKGFENEVAQIPDDLSNETNIKSAFNKAVEIVKNKNYTDPPMRGRQSINTLKKMKLVYIDDRNILRFTQMGNDLIYDKLSLGDVLLNFNFNSIPGIDVNPLILTLEFLVTLDKKMQGNSNGITRIEFEYYVMTISQWYNVNANIDELIKSRNDNLYSDNFKREIRTRYDNFKHANDYSDSSIKYLATSQYIVVSNDGYKISYNKDKLDEIESIIINYHNKKIADINLMREQYKRYNNIK